MIDNPQFFQVFGLNKAIKESRGEIIVRCDAHSEYPADYIKTLQEWHEKDIADNIGGCWETIQGANTLKARAIAIAMSFLLGVGFSYRTIHSGRERYVDTVPFGSWKKSFLDSMGLFDEQFIRAQDLEFNVRTRKLSKKILMLPWLKIKYYAQTNWSKLFAMLFQYGYWKNKVNKKHKMVTSLRQLGPSLFLIFGLFLLGAGGVFGGAFLLADVLYFLSYLASLLLVSFYLTSSRQEPFRLIFYLVASFIVMHFAYALGYLKGFWDCFISPKRERRGMV